MSELQLEKLILAREKAHAAKQHMQQISDDEKIKHMSRWNAEQDRPLTNLKADIVAKCIFAV